MVKGIQAAVCCIINAQKVFRGEIQTLLPLCDIIPAEAW